MTTTTKQYNFVRWFIAFAATAVMLFFSWAKGFLNVLLTNDTSYLSIVILGLFVVGSVFAGRTAYSLDRIDSVDSRIHKLKEPVRILNFLSDNFYGLGLLGTIIGFCYTMYNATSGGQDLAHVLAVLKKGMGTAGYTTLTGIASSLLMSLQIFLLTHYNHHEKP